MPRIGEALYRNGTLDEEIRSNIRNLFLTLRNTIIKWEVQTTLCAATSALREAPDSESFLTDLSAIIDAPIQILSGEEEARLTARGIVGYEPDLPENLIFIDVGGGSTELSRYRNGEVTTPLSLNLGALRLNRTFLGFTADSPTAPDKAAVEALRNHIRLVLNSEGAPLGRDAVPLLVGSSGTVRTITKLHLGAQQNSASLTRESLDALVEFLTTSNFEEIAGIEGMERNRADIIVAGALVVQEILHFFNARSLRASIFSLRHGLLKEHLEAVSIN